MKPQVIVSALLCLLLFNGCGSVSTTSIPDVQTVPTEGTAADTTAAEETETSSEETAPVPVQTLPPSDSGWNEAYLAKVRELNEQPDTFLNFSLYDVGGDATPELFVSAGGDLYVYSYRDGLIEAGVLGSYMAQYHTSSGILSYSVYTAEGGSVEYYARFNGDTLEEAEAVDAEQSDAVSLGEDCTAEESILNAVFTQKDTWQECYTDFLKELEQERRSAWETEDEQELMENFSLYDLDSDGTPELFVSDGFFHAASVEMFTYDSGYLHPIGNYGSYGAAAWYPKAELMNIYDIHMGYEYDAYYRYDSGMKDFFSVKILENNLGAAGDDAELYYRVDKKKVSEEEYNRVYEEWVPLEETVALGTGNALSESVIDEVIAAY